MAKLVNITTTVGIQGPAGPVGPPGSGAGATVSDTQPVNPSEGTIWFNPTTGVEMVYVLGVWQGRTIDGLYF